jgi:methylated-DNA-[protein]-cysteine S-methyltransferase
MPIFSYDTGIGRITIAEQDGFITNLYFESDKPRADMTDETPLIKEASRQLAGYLNGSLQAFSLPLAPAGTDFMKQVWTSLTEIPYGKTANYGDIDAKTGRPKAARAVGLANNRNPIPIIIPCHRVVGSDGSLTGYRGGLLLKKKLLELEKNGLILGYE